jgi:hypothetical protein
VCCFQEPHIDLINSLIRESGFVHIRRILLSLAVYLSLMVAFLWLPVQEYRFLCWLVGSSPAYQFQFWYIVPQIQIPIELLLGHITFLSVLDLHRNAIGHAEHIVFVWLAAKLGLTRYIIPLPMINKDKVSVR